MPDLSSASLYHGVAFAGLAAVLVMAAVSDWRTGLVRNALTYPAMAAGVAWAAVGGWWLGGGAGVELSAAVVALGTALAAFAMIFMIGGLGGGDVKLMAAVGAMSGDWRVVFATAVYAFVVGAVMAVGIMVGRGVVRQTGRRLFVATMLAAHRLDAEVAEGGEDEPRVPFAVAIAIGGIVAGMELLLGVRTPWAGFVAG